MAVPLEKFVKQLEDSGIIAGDTLKDFIPPKASPKDAEELERELIRQKKLTKFQAEEISNGRAKSLLLGNYVLTEKIGAGGMGQVFKAEHRRMKRTVAVKALPASTMKDPATIARFEREVTAAAKLEHPNIVTAHDADEANGVHFLVMQYVEGQDLSALVKKNGPFPVAQAVNYILQAARGLEFAHGEGVIHRDIKPANLLLDKKGTVKILDMGLARIQGDISGQAELTGTGAVMGTIDYMAPEQALSTKTADARADIYSLGCSLFYLLTGKATYDGETLMAKLLAHRESPIPALGSMRVEVPESIEVVFRKMVAKKLEDRYQAMIDVIHDLEGCSGRLPSVTATLPKTADSTQITSSPNTVDLLPTTSLKKTEPRRATATLTDADAAAEATMLTGDALQATNLHTRSLAASVELREKSLPPSLWKNRRVQIGGGLAALVILMAGIVVSITTKHGTLIVEVDQPSAAARVDENEKIHVRQTDGKETISISVDPGKAAPPDESWKKYDAGEFTWNSPAFQQWSKDVQVMPAEEQIKAVAKKLVELNPGFDGKLAGWAGNDPPMIKEGVVKAISFAAKDVADLSPVRAFSGLENLKCKGSGPNKGKLADLSPLQGMSLTMLEFDFNRVSDLSPLRGMPLFQLGCSATNVSDLSPLKGMPLQTLFLDSLGEISELSLLEGMKLVNFSCNYSGVSDLSPLKEMKLWALSCAGTKVRDLSPLKNMKLQIFMCHDNLVDDISVLRDMPLRTISLTPANITKGMEAIRNMTTIKALGVKMPATLSPAEFWKKYDAGEFGKPQSQ